jgi:hypothetical protein
MAERTTQIVGFNYESRLNQNARWALSEGSRHFDEKSAVHETLRRICKRLNELGTPYAVAGGMALFKHGFRRFTEDVDILITRHNLKLVHKTLSGLGYAPLFTGSKNLRDTDSGVRIEFLLAGDYPGDGKEKPVAFPNPSDVAEAHDDIRFVNLPTLVELKLASGMTGADRMKDLADVQELIKLLSLPVDFCNQLATYVQPKYRELWQATRGTGRRYIKLWRNKFLTVDAKHIDEMISTLREAANELARMRDDGVTLDPDGGTADDYAHLVTTDPDVARKYDMHDESEFWNDEKLGADETDESQET